MAQQEQPKTPSAGSSATEQQLKELGFPDHTAPEPEFHLGDKIVASIHAQSNYREPLPDASGVSAEEIVEMIARQGRGLLDRFASQSWFEKFRSLHWAEKNCDDRLNQVEEPLVLDLAKEFARSVMQFPSSANILLYDSKLDPGKEQNPYTLRVCKIFLSANHKTEGGQCALLLVAAQDQAGNYLVPARGETSADFNLERSPVPVLAGCLGRYIPRGPLKDPVAQVVLDSVTVLRELA